MSKFQGIFNRVENLEPGTDSMTRTSFQSTGLPLNSIQLRENNTRPLKTEHVQALAESIATLSLLEPLVVDSQGRLLAGGHRLAAIQLLKETNSLAYAQHFPKDEIPVRMMDFNAEQNPDRALECEIAENEQRRDYTPAEVRALADRLRQGGYIDRRGRPAEGEKALRPALQVIVGESWRQVVRYLKAENMTNVIINSPASEHLAKLKRLQSELIQWKKELSLVQSLEGKQLAKDINVTLRTLKLMIEQAKGENSN